MRIPRHLLAFHANHGFSPLEGWVFGKGGLFYKLPTMKGRGRFIYEGDKIKTYEEDSDYEIDEDEVANLSDKKLEKLLKPANVKYIDSPDLELFRKEYTHRQFIEQEELRKFNDIMEDAGFDTSSVGTLVEDLSIDTSSLSPSDFEALEDFWDELKGMEPRDFEDEDFQERIYETIEELPEKTQEIAKEIIDTVMNVSQKELTPITTLEIEKENISNPIIKSYFDELIQLEEILQSRTIAKFLGLYQDDLDELIKKINLAHPEKIYTIYANETNSYPRKKMLVLRQRNKTPEEKSKIVNPVIIEKIEPEIKMTDENKIPTNEPFELTTPEIIWEPPPRPEWAMDDTKEKEFIKNSITETRDIIFKLLKEKMKKDYPSLSKKELNKKWEEEQQDPKFQKKYGDGKIFENSSLSYLKPYINQILGLDENAEIYNSDVNPKITNAKDREYCTLDLFGKKMAGELKYYDTLQYQLSYRDLMTYYTKQINKIKKAEEEILKGNDKEDNLKLIEKSKKNILQKGIPIEITKFIGSPLDKYNNRTFEPRYSKIGDNYKLQNLKYNGSDLYTTPDKDLIFIAKIDGGLFYYLPLEDEDVISAIDGGKIKEKLLKQNFSIKQSETRKGDIVLIPIYKWKPIYLKK